MDHLFIRDLRLETRIGFLKREQIVPQTVAIDLEIGIAGEKVFTSDRVADCMDYDKVAAAVRELASRQHYKLVETLADRIAKLLLEQFAAPWVKVSVVKLGVMKDATRVGVSVERRR